MKVFMIGLGIGLVVGLVGGGYLHHRFGLRVEAILGGILGAFKR